MKESIELQAQNFGPISVFISGAGARLQPCYGCVDCIIQQSCRRCILVIVPLQRMGELVRQHVPCMD